MSFTSIDDLEKQIFCCNACLLCKDPNRGPTSYNGAPDSPLAIIGEGPGGVEDEYGVPLVGPSGQLLDKALASVKVTRDRVYTTNVIKCRPKNNRTPTIDEGYLCANKWLDKEIALVQPKIIIALGSVALKYLYKADARITKDRGLWFDTQYHVPAIGTYHPAYLLRLTGKALIKAKWEVFYDLKNAIEKCQALSPGYQFNSAQIPDLISLYQERRAARHIN